VKSGLVVLVFVALGLIVVRTFHIGGVGDHEWPVIVSVSPKVQRMAILYKTEGGGPTIGAYFIVRVRACGGNDGLRQVWSAYDTPPAHLEWLTDDTLVVVVPLTPRARENRSRRETRTGLPVVVTRESLFTASDLDTSPAFRP
jgi:hypothetical protein